MGVITLRRWQRKRKSMAEEAGEDTVSPFAGELDEDDGEASVAIRESLEVVVGDEEY
jgi:hypothetical protein